MRTIDFCQADRDCILERDDFETSSRSGVGSSSSTSMTVMAFAFDPSFSKFI